MPPSKEVIQARAEIELLNKLIADLVKCQGQAEQVLIDCELFAGRGTIRAVAYALAGLIRQLRAAVLDIERYPR